MNCNFSIGYMIKPCVKIIKHTAIKILEESEMAQQVKIFTIKTNDLNFIPETNMKRSNSCKLYSNFHPV